MKAKQLEEMWREDLLERLVRIEQRYPARKADIKFLVTVVRALLSQLNERQHDSGT